MAHEHWGTFPPANPLIRHFIGLLFFLLWLMNCLGNGMVIYIFVK